MSSYTTCAAVELMVSLGLRSPVEGKSLADSKTNKTNGTEKKQPKTDFLIDKSKR